MTNFQESPINWWEECAFLSVWVKCYIDVCWIPLICDHLTPVFPYFFFVQMIHILVRTGYWSHPISLCGDYFVPLYLPLYSTVLWNMCLYLKSICLESSHLGGMVYWWEWINLLQLFWLLSLDYIFTNIKITMLASFLVPFS